MSIVRERRGDVEIIRIDRPEAKNAINGEVAQAIEGALNEIEADSSVRVVVLTGTGDTFSAGADLKVVARGGAAELNTERGGFAGLTERAFPKPIIAAVNGTAVAGGFEIVLACDLVVAVETARFGLFEVKRGLFAAGGGLARMPRRIPPNIAMEIAIAANTLDARRGYELGLVNRLAPEGDAVNTALALAAEVAANAPLAVRATRAMVRSASELTESEAWARGRELSREVFAHPDAIEGSTAFAEKRPPVWTSS